MAEQLVPSSEFEGYGDFNPERIAAVFNTRPRLIHFEIIRDPKTREIVRKVPVYEIDIVGPTTFESIAIYLKPDTRTVRVQAFSRPINIAAGMRQNFLIEAGTIPEGSIPTHIAFFEKRVDRLRFTPALFLTANRHTLVLFQRMMIPICI